VRLILKHPLAAYYALAFGLSWACWLPLVVERAVVRPGAWPSHVPGLLGPAVAALAVTAVVAGRGGLARLAPSFVRWRMGLVPWLVVTSPVVLFAATLLVTGQRPAWSDLGTMNGFPVGSPIALWILLTLVDGYGEEIGWRGFAFAHLRQRHGVAAASLMVAPLWALWHLPTFALLESYRGFGAGSLVGFTIGIASGALVLGWLYERSGRSLLAVALWHATYNLFSGTAAARGAVAAVETTAVILLAVALIGAELRSRYRELRTSR